jgi:aminoglycoside phosphotransferase (APT) family kinase protein
VLFCPDREVIGTPFYLMERLSGRIFWEPTLPEMPREERAGIYEGMAEALARLHMADPQAIGLADFGRPGNYFARQIGRWSKQWDQSRTRDNPAVDKLAEWLPQHLPDSDEVAICHGDFRLDNMIFAADEPRVIGILDWELSTLGHPLADLAYNCMPYINPPAAFRGMRGPRSSGARHPEPGGVPGHVCAPDRAGGHDHALPPRLLAVPDRRDPRGRDRARSEGECVLRGRDLAWRASDAPRERGGRGCAEW